MKVWNSYSQLHSVTKRAGVTLLKYMHVSVDTIGSTVNNVCPFGSIVHILQYSHGYTLLSGVPTSATYGASKAAVNVRFMLSHITTAYSLI